MDCPTKEMYGASGKILLIGTAKKQDWALTIDIDPCSPADITCDGAKTPFNDKAFDYVILDFTTNFMHPNHVESVIREANRIGKRVMGRCHISEKQITLRGYKQAFCHKEPPLGVEWIEVRKH
jgi:hypothetical protein